jgi:branched-chain amino acid transport system permease protein
MTTLLFVEQSLNGLQFGIMLFLMAAGMTLMLGIMNLVNLAYGALYMLGAYFAVSLQEWTGSFLFAVAGALVGTAALGMIMEKLTFSQLYARSYLDQVLCTIGLNMFFNELARIIWGSRSLNVPVPSFLTGTITLLPGLDYPVLRIVIILVGLAVAAGLYLLITSTKTGIQIRAGASDRATAGLMGINTKQLFMLIFGLASALAGLAGVMAAPLLSVGVNMGDNILVLTLVVIVVGGMGSVRGALLAAILIGLIDTWGRMLLPAALGSVSIYLLMAAVLYFKPSGLFPATR